MATPTNLPAAQTTGNVLTAAYVNDVRGAFRVLQVVSTNVTAITASTTSATFVDTTGMSVSITPQSTSNKILIFVTMNVGGSAADDTFYNLLRNSTNLAQGVGGTSNATMTWRFADGSGTNENFRIASLSTNFLDSPASTSAITYKMQWRTRVGTIYLNRRSDTNVAVSSTITAMEISA